MIDFELIFVCGIRRDSRFILFYVACDNPIIAALIVEIVVIFFYFISLAPL